MPDPTPFENRRPQGSSFLHRLRPTPNAIVLSFVPLWVVAATLIQNSPESPWRIVGILVIGLVLAAMDGAMHEAAHGHLVQGRSGNWIAGFLFAAPGLLSITAYRIYHQRHHRQALSESSSVTEGLHNGTPLYLLAIPCIGWRHARGRDRVQITIEYLLIGSGVTGVAILATRDGAVSAVRDLWLLPLAISMVITCFRGWSEGIAKWLLSRSTNPPRFTPLGLLYWSTCDHLIHHLWPGAPWYKRGPLSENLWREHQSLEPSGHYLRFLWNRFEKSRSKPPAIP